MHDLAREGTSKCVWAGSEQATTNHVGNCCEINASKVQGCSAFPAAHAERKEGEPNIGVAAVASECNLLHRRIDSKRIT